MVEVSELAGSSGLPVSSPLLQATARFHHTEPERGSLAFPACPPWPSRFRAGPPRDFPDSSDHVSALAALVTFASPSETHLDSCGLASSIAVTSDFRAKLLSWGFPKISSPPASTPRVHSQMVAHPSARGCQPSYMFRPCRSSRLRRFSPRDPSQVYCALQPVLRFAPFPTFGVIAPACLHAVRPTPQSSPAALRSCAPFRAFPSSSAVPCHHGPCLLTVFPRSQGLSRPTSPLSR